MEKKHKNLVAARKKLKEYKQSKQQLGGVTERPKDNEGLAQFPGATTFVSVDETPVQLPCGVSVEPNVVPSQPMQPPPPPTEPIPDYLNNLYHNNHSGDSEESKVLNLASSPELNNSSPPEYTGDSSFTLQLNPPDNHVVFTPSAPSVPISDDVENVVGNQHLIDRSDIGQNFPVSYFQSTPIACEYQPVSFNTNFQQPQVNSFENLQLRTSNDGSDAASNVSGPGVSPLSDHEQPQVDIPSEFVFTNPIPSEETNNLFSNEQKSSESVYPSVSPLCDIQQSETFTHFHSSAPLSELMRMLSVQEALELQIQELRRDNERLLTRQSELLAQLESGKELIQELQIDKEKCKEEAKKLTHPLQAKINTLYEENQRILKNSNEVGLELRAKLQEKSKLYEDMQQAFIIVSKSKMELAADLDQQKERTKELEIIVEEKDRRLHDLILKQRNMVFRPDVPKGVQTDFIVHDSGAKSQHVGLPINTELERNDCNGHKHGGECDVVDEHNHGTCDSHSHTHADESDLQQQNHDHDHHHDHNHHHNNEQDCQQSDSFAIDAYELQEMKKRLHHLEWENSTFRSDVEKLAAEAKDKKYLEEQCAKLTVECDHLKSECQKLELVVVQLQSENDTIGDYIALYQTQKLALKESAKEKDTQLKILAKERESLMHKMDELTELLKTLRGAQQENVANENQSSSSEVPPHDCPGMNPSCNPHNKEIQVKIKNLLTEISSSNLMDNIHPCAVCSGKLLDV